MKFATNLLSENVKILKSEVSKSAYQGVAIAIGAIIIATLGVVVVNGNEISLDSISKAQSENYALWVLDSIPFIFGFWGQHASSIIAYQAGAIILDQTQELRSRADSMEEQANYSATHDLVTDLPNRALFYDRVEQAILSANSRNRLLSILLIEVANFKEIYDTLGRNSSDLLLKQIATRLQHVVVGVDSVARIDGNIFSLLVPATDNANAGIELAKNVQSSLEPAFKAEHLSLTVHCNIGIVNFPEHGDDVDSLVQKAGVALFMAGKSPEGYVVYSPSFDDHSPRRLTLMGELRRAIQQDQLQVYYQPKVSVQTGRLHGVEALVRWIHPRHGFIPPEEFVPMAERTRMIKHLTMWVLKRAFKQCVEWHKQGLELIVSINLSARDLHDPELADIIAGTAVAAGIQPAWIMLEITESSIITDPERTLEIVQRLHGMGYKFSIDDFGTGYSSLGYLKKMPLTELKIDKSFIGDMLQSDNDAVIVKATINLAHNLGLAVTAEGVESEEVLSLLNSYDCDIAQGYYFGKPQSAESFNQWVNSQAPGFINN